MINKPFDEVDSNDIRGLVINKVSEKKTIEYKQELPGNADEAKKEFLADVSSFANASGGDLIYGISEERDSKGKNTGMPESADGLDGINPDEEIRRLENIIQSSLAPRVAGIQIKAILGFTKGPIIFIRIPKSWNSPHMVTFKNWSRFHARNSTGKYQLDVDEIRSAFLASESLAEKIKEFRIDRIAKIVADETPIPLVSNPKVVLHLLPISSFSPGEIIDLSRMGKEPFNLPLINFKSPRDRFNFDGFLSYGILGNSVAYSYTQLFRNGCIEAVDSTLLQESDNGKQIRSLEYEQRLIQSLANYLNLQRKLGITPPIFVMLSFLNVKDYTMSNFFSIWGDPGLPIDRDILPIPEILVEDYTETASHILRPAFDAVWQACGRASCENYDENGNWIGNRK